MTKTFASLFAQSATQFALRAYSASTPNFLSWNLLFNIGIEIVYNPDIANTCFKYVIAIKPFPTAF